MMQKWTEPSFQFKENVMEKKWYHKLFDLTKSVVKDTNVVVTSNNEGVNVDAAYTDKVELNYNNMNDNPSLKIDVNKPT